MSADFTHFTHYALAVFFCLALAACGGGGGGGDGNNNGGGEIINEITRLADLPTRPSISGTGSNCAADVACEGRASDDRLDIVSGANPIYVDAGAGNDIVTLGSNLLSFSGTTACGAFTAVSVCGGAGDNDWLVINENAAISTITAAEFEVTEINGGQFDFVNSELGRVILKTSSPLIGIDNITLRRANTLNYVQIDAGLSGIATIVFESDAVITFAGDADENDCDTITTGQQRFCGPVATGGVVYDAHGVEIDITGTHIDQIHIISEARAGGAVIAPKTITLFSGIERLELEDFASLGTLTLGASGTFGSMGSVHQLILSGTSSATSITGTAENDYVELFETASVTATTNAISGGGGTDWLYLGAMSQIGDATFNPESSAPITGFERLTLELFNIGSAGSGVDITLGTGSGLFADTSDNIIRFLELSFSGFHGSITGSAQADIIIISLGESVLDYIDGEAGDDRIVLGQNSGGNTYATNIIFNESGALTNCDGQNGTFRLCGGAGNDTLVISSMVTFTFNGNNETLANTTAGFETCTEATELTRATCLTGGDTSTTLPIIAGTEGSDCAGGVACEGTDNEERINIISTASPSHVNAGAGNDIVTLESGATTPFTPTACGSLTAGICGGTGNNDWLVIEGPVNYRPGKIPGNIIPITAAGFEVTQLGEGQIFFADSELGRVTITQGFPYRDQLSFFRSIKLNYVKFSPSANGAPLLIIDSSANISFAGTDDCDAVKAGNQRICGSAGTAISYANFMSVSELAIVTHFDGVLIRSGATLDGTPIDSRSALTSTNLFSGMEVLVLQDFTSGLGAITLGTSGNFGNFGSVHTLILAGTSSATSITGTAENDYIVLHNIVSVSDTTNAISGGTGTDWLDIDGVAIKIGSTTKVFDPIDETAATATSGFERLTLNRFNIGSSGSGIAITLGTGPGVFADASGNEIRFLEILGGTFYGSITGSDDADIIIMAGGIVTLDYINGDGGNDTIMLGRDSNGSLRGGAFIFNASGALTECDGQSGKFRICGGAGDDTLIISSAVFTFSATDETLASTTEGFEACAEAEDLSASECKTSSAMGGSASATRALGSRSRVGEGTSGEEEPVRASGFENLVFEFALQLESALIPALQDMTRHLTADVPEGTGQWAEQHVFSGGSGGVMHSAILPEIAAEAAHEYKMGISRQGAQSDYIGFSSHLLQGEISSGDESFRVLGYGGGVNLRAEIWGWQARVTALGTRFEIEEEAVYVNAAPEAVAEGMQYLIGGEVSGQIMLGALVLRPHAEIFWQETRLDAGYFFIATPSVSHAVGVEMLIPGGRIGAAMVYDGDTSISRNKSQTYDSEGALELDWKQSWVETERFTLSSEANYQRGLEFGRENTAVRMNIGLSF